MAETFSLEEGGTEKWEENSATEIWEGLLIA